MGKAVPYCSRQCQASDWPTHKLTCGGTGGTTTATAAEPKIVEIHEDKEENQQQQQQQSAEGIGVQEIAGSSNENAADLAGID